MITTQKLTKTFKAPAGDLTVLDSIDLSIDPGQMVAIVGASGVGKSTLLHILGTLDQPSTGKVLYDGADVFAMADSERTAFRNSTIGFVFQFHHLLPEFTALENVLMPAYINRTQGDRKVQDYAHALLDELGVGHRAGHRPGELSGGEQQRVAVARALILNPKAVLADEPTGNLDTATGEELFKLLMAINQRRGTTFVIVTHNKQLSDKCHKTFEMVDGRINN